jgi:oligopeptide/dipeptide ABC transporter ATP-binding protein
LTLLEIQNLRSRLSTPDGAALAVDGVDLSIEDGEVVGIVGESGSGKTALALSILGLLPTGSGSIAPGSSIRLRGEELIGLERKRLRQIRGGEIAMIFQEPMTSLNPVLSIGRQIQEVLEAHRSLDRSAARKEVVRLLGEVGIPDPEVRAKGYPHEFSGGMRQRVMIAMALAGQPSLLVADEPTTALDVTLQAQILDLLKEIQTRMGMALLLISHDIGVVSRVCHRVVVLYGGKVVEAGSTEEILEQPMHPYTQGLLASRLFPLEGRRTLTPIPGEVPEARNWPSGCRFHPRCSEAMARCESEEPRLLSISGAGEGSGKPEGVDSQQRSIRCWLRDAGRDGEA